MEQKFPQGVRAFKPRENAPDFIVTELVIAIDLLIQYMNDNPDVCSYWNTEKQIKLTVLKSKDGTKHNVQVNTFKPKPKNEVPF